MKTRKKVLTEEQAERNRQQVLRHYYKNRERLKNAQKERYYRIKDELSHDPEKRMEYSIYRSSNAALYYANKKMRQLAEVTDLNDERLLSIVRIKALLYMFDPGTVIKHIQKLKTGHPRVKHAETRTMAMIMNEVENSYTRIYLNTKNDEQHEG